MTRTATPPEQAYRRDAATLATFGGLFGFGIAFALLGPVLPYLRQSEHISYLVGALHQVGYALGGMTAGILATRSTAPRQRTIVVGLIGAAIAGLLLGYGRILPVTIAAASLGNVFATSALIRMWALVADLHPRHRAVAMSEGEVVVSLAGVVTPAVVSVSAATVVGWRFSVVVTFVVGVACAIAISATRLPAPEPPPRPEPGPVSPGNRTQWRSLTVIFAIVGLEFALSFWAASYLHDDVGLARDTSVALVSALYGANLVGRLLASRLARRLAVRVVLWLSLATAAAGLPLLLGAGNIGVATVGLAVTGMGIGGTFPLASSLHIAASHRTADQALGQILTVAGVGQIVGPVVAGALAQGAGLRVGLLVLPVLVGLAAIMARR